VTGELLVDGQGLDALRRPLSPTGIPLGGRLHRVMRPNEGVDCALAIMPGGVEVSIYDSKRVGSFVFTGLTMNALLDSGYSVVAVDQEKIDWTILAEIWGGISPSTNLGTAFYLQRAHSLFKCAEVPESSFSLVACFMFAPQIGNIDVGTEHLQQNSFNVLEGEWKGATRGGSIHLEQNPITLDRILRQRTC
jgi:hypothetical protein